MPSGCALILTSFISTTTSDSACYDVAYWPILLKKAAVAMRFDKQRSAQHARRSPEPQTGASPRWLQQRSNRRPSYGWPISPGP